jgi:hypothetical protein
MDTRAELEVLTNRAAYKLAELEVVTNRAAYELAELEVFNKPSGVV